jgi:Tol biopolymer transport system component
MNADGSDLHPLPNTSGAAAVSWSPDGKRLAYIVHHSDDDWSMYVVDADGSSPTRLADTSTNDFGPTWKPASVATAAADWVNSGLQLGRGWGLALGDLNGDQYLDVVVFNDSEGNTIWLNDGTGKFVDTGQRLGTRNCWEVALGDLDRDGDLDVVLSHGDQPVPAEVWWNRLVH